MSLRYCSSEEFTITSETEDCPRIKSLAEKIACSECSFALCQFEKALVEANEILATLKKIPRIPNEINVIQSQNCLLDSFELRKPVHLSPSSLSRTNLSNGKHKVKESNSFTVRLLLKLGEKCQISSIRERASAVAIQCSYEIYERETRKDEGKRNDEHISERQRQKLLKNLTPFLRCYCLIESENENDGEQGEVMSLDLVVLYLQFCHSIGLYQSTVICIIHILIAMVNLRTENKVTAQLKDERDEYDSLYNYCHELLSLLFVQILSRAKDVRFIHLVTDAISTIIQPEKTGEMETFFHLCSDTGSASFVEEGAERDLASVYLLKQKIDTIINFKMDENETIINLLQEVIENVKSDIVQLINQLDTKENSFNDSLKSNVPNYDKNNPLSFSDTVDAAFENLMNKRGGNHDTDVDKEGVDKFIHHLWDAEDRWINRVKLIGIGFISYSAWRRRRHIYGMGKTLISPLREIASALTPKS